ncbi:MAG: hypothetical protein JWP95_309 [Actinotalea sp.]|nr:hypothetical protein [Actinotalea sp.]
MMAGRRTVSGAATEEGPLELPFSRFFPAAPDAGTTGDPGLFGPGSAAWRVGRERALLAGGPAALLLQVAHPLVAAGVAAHSDFTGDPLRRLHGTLDAVLTVTFGDRDQVRTAVRRVSDRHRTVRGALPVGTGPFAAGTPYRAADGELALWVFATLSWTTISVSDGFVRPLPVDAREAYYRDMREFGRLFGVPSTLLPATFADLHDYVRSQVHETLVVGPVARRLAAQILRPDPPIVAWPARPLPVLLAGGVLPPPVRDAYGLRWGRSERLAFAALQRSTRVIIPLLPSRVRLWPHSRIADQRMGGRSKP